MIIYKVTNLVNNKVYIGKTVNTLAQRKGKHIYEAFRRNSKYVFHRALRKYGTDNFKWVIIDNSNSEEGLKEKEIYWISFYNSFGTEGYNLTIGGEGATGYKMSDESKKKRNETLIRNHTDYLRGSQIGTSKLTETDVYNIKELIKQGGKYENIADIFNVSYSTVSDIKMGNRWKHVGEDISNINIKSKKLTENEILEIKSLIKEGKISQYEISKKFNVAQCTISEIKLGKSYREFGEDVSTFKRAKVKLRKLTEENVKDIKLLLEEGKMTHQDIANQFNVAKSLIGYIKKKSIEYDE